MSNEKWPEHLKHSAPAESVNPYHKLTPVELGFLLAIGQRAARIVAAWMKEHRNRDVECNPDIIAQDFAVAHLAKPIRLRALLESSELEFLEDFITVQKNINRPLAFFPAYITLRFAATGSVYVIGD